MERYRVRYSKVGRLRFISHLDIIQYFSRLVVRARLPVTLTQGFNPKAKFEFGPALPMGFTSTAEYLHLHLDEALPAADVEQILQREGIVGLAVLAVTAAPAEKLSRAMTGYRYRAEFRGPAGELERLARWDQAAIEAAEMIHPGTLKSVTVLEKDENRLLLDWQTLLVEGRVADPRVLVRLEGAAGLELDCHKEEAFWKNG